MSDCRKPCAVGKNEKAVADLHRAMVLEMWTIGWMIVEALISIGAGISTGSLLLVVFGADSVIELASGLVLYRRLSYEYHARHDIGGKLQELERRTGKIAGYLLYALAVYVVIQAAWGLWQHHQADSSLLGILVALVAAFWMPFLARAKIRLAERIGSSALRADAMETLTCGYLSWVLLAGLLANALLHWWWLDAVASLVVVPLLVREGKESISGKCACHE